MTQKQNPKPNALAGRTERGAETRQLLVEAAIGTLKDRGFAGASARVIAERAGVNQALVFYYFGSVTGLLLAALDDVSATRMARYGEAVSQVTSPVELVGVASSIFREDLEAGHIAVLTAMMAGASSTPGLGDEIARRIGTWTEFALTALTGVITASGLGSLLPAEELAFAVVALYLGMEMLTQLDGDRSPAEALFARATSIAQLFDGAGVANVPSPAQAQSTSKT